MSESTISEVARPRAQLERWVAGRADVLQTAYRADAAWAVRRLAVLRRAASAPVGVAPGVWEELSTLPADLVGSGDDASRGELSAQTALFLFALHQQSHRNRPMHVTGRRLGQALRALSPDPDPDQATVRRFTALGSATSFDQAIRHLRGLVTQLRAAEIGLDYGQLAGGLYDLQSPRLRDGVRLRWSRDFYTRPPQTSPEDTPTEPGDLS